MATTYDEGDGEINGRIRTLIDEHFKDLKESKAKIKVLFAVNDEGPAVKLHGYPCGATIKNLPLQQRVLIGAAALMTVDKRHYDELNDRQRDGLMHHELHHLLVTRDKESDNIVVDDLGMPKFKMRKHDIDFGWFAATARLFGKDSPEVIQARQIVEVGGEFFFPFIVDKPMRALLPDRKQQAKEQAEKERADADAAAAKKVKKPKGKKGEPAAE